MQFLTIVILKQNPLLGLSLILTCKVKNEEKLLFFNVKDGWEPLCKFLDLPTPKEPFPYK